MFRRLLAYFLLLNFLNTLFFPEMKVWENSPAYFFQSAETAPDEIDSLVEFVAEYCLDLGDDFSESDLDDQPDNLKSRTLHDCILPGTFVFEKPPGFLVRTRSDYSCLFPVNFFEIDSPPPKPGLV